MTLFTRRAGCAALLLIAAVLAGCGDSEPDQRKAFIKFLDDINRRVGVHFMVPTAEDRAAFGDYMKHYTIILDFNEDMKTMSADYQNAMKSIGPAGPQTLEQMAARRQDFARIKDTTTNLMQAFETRLAKAKAERATLTQPDDLKTVYSKTFDKLIAAPVQAMIVSDQALLAYVDSSAQVADYINQNRGRLTVSGSQMRAKDAKALAEINALIKAHQEAQKRFEDAQRAGDRVVNGR